MCRRSGLPSRLRRSSHHPVRVDRDIDDIQNAATVVSLDTPSGLDVTSGIAPGTVVSADATLTLALPKQGLRHSPHVGELYLADISVPASVTAQFGMQSPRFDHHGIVRIAD